MKNTICSWSGGKDCSYALLESKKMGYNPIALVSMIDEDLMTSRSHGLPVKMLEKQAKAMGIELVTKPTSRENYETNFINTLKSLKASHNIESMVFGDIDLMAHRVWIDRVCEIAGIEAVFPLWNRKRELLASEIVNAGIKSVIVACNSKMGAKYLGKIYSSDMIDEFKTIGIDTCGEDGEFHSFVIDGPHFIQAVQIPEIAHKKQDDFHFIDWKNMIIN